MNKYYSTIPAGFQQIAKKELEKLDVQIQHVYEGLLIYTTQLTPIEIGNISYFVNSFLVIAEFDTYKGQSNEHILKNIDNIALKHLQKYVKPGQSFRVRNSYKNQTVSVNEVFLKSLENNVVKHCSLKVNRSLSDLELWSYVRSEGFGMFGLLIPNAVQHIKPYKGELKPQIAYLMCNLAELQSSNVVMDPFAGHGAIAKQIINFWEYKGLIANDKDDNLYLRLGENLTHTFKNKIINEDATNLKSVLTSSVNKIVTDPPWGLFKEAEVTTLYNDMAKEFYRVLANDGVVVILTAKEKELKEAFKENFKLETEFNVLVSGKKAGLFKFIKD
ncbi:MAG: hypothetical protein R3B92_04450 [Patescibacteria group bacterium]|uniref:Ribosomal RNA large subunit methyltransferase K/L-like methyltransferase domain-containing protein n=1 Tax=candidate division WWE3 bacterium TaxID=2053526 RepID=A0A955J1J0_UNCKA|nr:hypothetical protein [candidate division WWE3 bacterium]